MVQRPWLGRDCYFGLFADGFREDWFGFGSRGLEWEDSVATIVVCMDATVGYYLKFASGRIT